jgi:hypothetical protein
MLTALTTPQQLWLPAPDQISQDGNIDGEGDATLPNQTKPNRTKPNQTKPNQTKQNKTKQKTLHLRNIFSKEIGYKISTHKSVAFLYTCTNKLRKKRRKPFTVSKHTN